MLHVYLVLFNILLVVQDSSVRAQYLSWSTTPLFCFHTEDLKSQKGKGSVPGFLEAGGSFKAGPCYYQPDLVSMEAASRSSLFLSAWGPVEPQPGQAVGLALSLVLGKEAQMPRGASLFLLLLERSNWLCSAMLFFSQACMGWPSFLPWNTPSVGVLLRGGWVLWRI